MRSSTLVVSRISTLRSGARSLQTLTMVSTSAAGSVVLASASGMRRLRRRSAKAEITPRSSLVSSRVRSVGSRSAMGWAST